MNKIENVQRALYVQFQTRRIVRSWFRSERVARSAILQGYSSWSQLCYLFSIFYILYSFSLEENKLSVPFDCRRPRQHRVTRTQRTAVSLPSDLRHFIRPIIWRRYGVVAFDRNDRNRIKGRGARPPKKGLPKLGPSKKRTPKKKSSSKKYYGLAAFLQP